MKIVTYRAGDAWRPGAVLGENVYDVARALEHVDGEALPGDFSTLDLLREHGGELALISATVRKAVQRGLEAASRLDDAVLTSPVPNPGKVLCIGLNYRNHVAETGRKLPEHPDVFTKFTTSLTGPNDAIGGLWATSQLDFEGELAVVIGRTARRVEASRALDFVAGAMVLNDVTARDLQYRGTQWVMGKSVDASTPSGPTLVTLDEVGDLQSLEVTTWVNGVEMQHSNTRHMIFSVADIIAYLSRTITLEPGDIIATGTPEGIGAKRTPPVWLQPGDDVTIHIERVGVLKNVVGAASE